jgi:hypothetical protein
MDGADTPLPGNPDWLERRNSPTLINVGLKHNPVLDDKVHQMEDWVRPVTASEGLVGKALFERKAPPASTATNPTGRAFPALLRHWRVIRGRKKETAAMSPEPLSMDAAARLPSAASRSTRSCPHRQPAGAQ